MRKSFSIITLAGALALGGCAYGGMGGPLESVLGGVLGAGTGGYGYENQDFERAAVNACGNQASQYGRVSITDVRQQSSSSLRVYGTVNTGYQNRNFACTFRSDGRITDFDI